MERTNATGVEIQYREIAVTENEHVQNGLVKKVPDPTSAKQSVRTKYTSCRWGVAYNACLVTMVLNATRMNLSMAVVCMAAEEDEALYNVTDQNGNNTTYNVTYPNQTTLFQILEADEAEGDWTVQWNSETEGWILSSYGIGFALTPLIGGYMGGKFSAKLLVTVSLMLTCLTTLLFPVTVLVNAYLVFAMRFITGMCSGIIIPNIVELWSSWAPKSERTQLLTFSIAGLTISSIITFPISGFLCMIEVQRGWPFIFYVFGSFTFLSCILWMYYIYDTPNHHPRISEEEKLYISSENSKKKRKASEY